MFVEALLSRQTIPSPKRLGRGLISLAPPRSAATTFPANEASHQCATSVGVSTRFQSRQKQLHGTSLCTPYVKSARTRGFRSGRGASGKCGGRKRISIFSPESQGCVVIFEQEYLLFHFTFLFPSVCKYSLL